MLIRHAELWPPDKSGRGRAADVRIGNGVILAIGALDLVPGERVIDAKGGVLLPGLHDHHIHLFALAASLDSVRCGPPDVTSDRALAAALAGAGGEGWLRGISYHESVAGDIDRHWLDAVLPHRPVRIQHRGGRLWIVNSPGLALLTRGVTNVPDGFEYHDNVPTGRIYEADTWMREQLGGDFPDLARVSSLLAANGVTGVTEMTPANNSTALDHLAAQQSAGRLKQRVQVAGQYTLPSLDTDELAVMATKLHLHESWLPDYDETCRLISDSHARDRPVAIHCVTRTELVFALAALAEAGSIRGDRIEHASVAPPELVARIAEMGLAVVGQPGFVAERGDAYLASVGQDDLPWLYRARAFVERGIPFAGGSDAPFGDADPWRAVRAAVERRTANGYVLSPDEALSPEQAMRLFFSDPCDVRVQRMIVPGAVADLCLLDRCWHDARQRLHADQVRTVIRGGQVIHQAPN